MICSSRWSFTPELASELGEFTMGDLLERLIAKMVSRHPHVFGDASVSTATEALAQWEAIKQREADRERSAAIGSRRRAASPARVAARAARASKAARVRFDWPDAAAAWDEGRGRVREAADVAASGRRADPRGARRRAVFAGERGATGRTRRRRGAGHAPSRRFRQRFADMERDLLARGTSSGRRLRRARALVGSRPRARSAGQERT